jgi:hypothetical protein
MKTKLTSVIASAILALSIAGGTLAVAGTLPQTAETPDRTIRKLVFQTSPTSLSDAIITAEAAADGRVLSIGYQNGDCCAPDMIMADVVQADGTGKTVAINPVDGKVLYIANAVTDQYYSGLDGGAGNDADGAPGSENASH